MANELIYFEKYDEPKIFEEKIGNKIYIRKVEGEWKSKHPEIEKAVMLGGFSGTKENKEMIAMWNVILKTGARNVFRIHNLEDYSESFDRIIKWIESNPSPNQSSAPITL